MAVSVAVCEVFSIEEWCDLENRVRVHSRSLEMAPFDRSRVEFLLAFHSNYGAISYRLRDTATFGRKSQNFYTPPVFGASQGVTPSEFRQYV